MKMKEKALERFDIPGEAAGEMRLSLSGDRRLSIENHRGILEFSPERLRINCGDRELGIRGEGLRLRFLAGKAAIVEGRILALELE